MSLVPSEIATRPSRTSPTPIRLHGLSPDHATTFAAGRPCRACQYGESRPAIVHDGAIAGSFAASPGAVASTRGVPPLPRREIHQVRARRVAGIDRRVAADQQRRQKRADQMNAIGGGVAAGIVASQNLRICGPVKRSKAREPVCCASAAAPPTAP